MSYWLRPYAEYPNLRLPIALIVDDPAPCINPLWYFRHQVDGQQEPVYCRDIPLSFMEDWCAWVQASGIRGDFTILPYPAALGRIDDGLTGYSAMEVKAWLDLARTYIMPQFDIHCEILTHTNALDLTTKQLRNISEHAWMDAQDEATLTEYFATAMQILKDAGVPNYGLTQPCTFTGDESMYARAILAAEQKVNNRSVTHNFLHVDWVAPIVPPRITLLNADAGEAVVSVWAATNDYIWNTQEHGHPYQTLPPQEIADRFLTADGTGGRVADLVRARSPIVLVTHWQSLFSNGTQAGLATYREVIPRIEANLGTRVQWKKLSELSEDYLAMQTTSFQARATPTVIEMDAVCPFDANTVTVSIPTPWPLFTGPDVSINGMASPQVVDESELVAGKWIMRGSIVTISLPLTANVPAHVRIVSKPA